MDRQAAAQAVREIAGALGKQRARAAGVEQAEAVLVELETSRALGRAVDTSAEAAALAARSEGQLAARVVATLEGQLATALTSYREALLEDLQAQVQALRAPVREAEAAKKKLEDEYARAVGAAQASIEQAERAVNAVQQRFLAVRDRKLDNERLLADALAEST